MIASTNVTQTDPAMGPHAAAAGCNSGPAIGPGVASKTFIRDTEASAGATVCGDDPALSGCRMVWLVGRLLEGAGKTLALDCRRISARRSRG